MRDEYTQLPAKVDLNNKNFCQLTQGLGTGEPSSKARRLDTQLQKLESDFKTELSCAEQVHAWLDSNNQRGKWTDDSWKTLVEINHQQLNGPDGIRTQGANLGRLLNEIEKRKTEISNMLTLRIAQCSGEQ